MIRGFRFSTRPGKREWAVVVRALTVDDSVVYLGGDFTNAGGDSNADRVARWTWDAPQGSNAVTGAVGDAVTITGEGFVGVPQTGGVFVGSIPATYTRDDSATITFTVPAGVSGVQALSVTGVGGQAPSAPSPPPRHRHRSPIRPGAPTGVTGVAGDGQVSVSWTAPVSSGSFPITTYAVSSTSGHQGCLTSAPAVTCVVSGLTNGTPYSFQVRALNGAGWGPWSAASDPVTPEAPVATSILITGSRGEVRGRPGVIVTGTSTGLGMGAIVRPMVKLAGADSYTQGTASILVDEAGDFTWQRRTGKKNICVCENRRRHRPVEPGDHSLKDRQTDSGDSIVTFNAFRHIRMRYSRRIQHLSAGRSAHRDHELDQSGQHQRFRHARYPMPPADLWWPAAPQSLADWPSKVDMTPSNAGSFST